MSSTKTELTYDEKLKAAHAYLINGIPQHHIASMYGVNPGRVSEAVAAVSTALGFPDKRMRKVVTKSMKNDHPTPLLTAPAKSWEDETEFR
jgi:hypothetical protein